MPKNAAAIRNRFPRTRPPQNAPCARSRRGRRIPSQSQPSPVAGPFGVDRTVQMRSVKLLLERSRMRSQTRYVRSGHVTARACSANVSAKRTGRKAAPFDVRGLARRCRSLHVRRLRSSFHGGRKVGRGVIAVPSTAGEQGSGCNSIRRPPYARRAETAAPGSGGTAMTAEN